MNYCKCGKKLDYRSKNCRECWKNGDTLKEHGIRTGFRKGYTPWNRATKGLTYWKPERRKKMMVFLATGGGMKGKTHKIETRRRVSESMRGEKCYNWQGGITKLNKGNARKDVEWSIWKDNCLIRDNYTCRICLKKGVQFQIHHIKLWSKYPQLRYEVSNGITLCKPCHKLVFHKEEQTINFFQNILKYEKRYWLDKLQSVLSGLKKTT